MEAEANVKKSVRFYKSVLIFSTNLNNSRTMSMSAPSAINTDFSTVKFEDETTEWNIGTSHIKSAMSHRFVSPAVTQTQVSKIIWIARYIVDC